MSGIYGFHQLTDYSYNYAYNKVKPLQTQNPKNLLAAENTVYGVLQRSKHSKIFSFLLRNSGMDKYLSACPGKYTIFIVPDDKLREQYGEECFLRMDRLDSLKMVRNHIIENIITLNDIRTEEVSLLTNINNNHSLFVQQFPKNNIMTVNDAVIINEIPCVNGNIIFIDSMLLSYEM